MEMAWTIEDEWLDDDIKQDIIRITDAIDDCVLDSDRQTPSIWWMHTKDYGYP